MKKTLVLFILCLSMMVAVVGCSKDKDGDNSGTEGTPTPVDSNEEDVKDGDTDTSDLFENPVAKEDYDFNDYIKLGKYKGLEVSVKQLEVTDEDIDVAIQMDLLDNGATPVDVTDRAVKIGDTINIDFVGYHNGEPFDGGAADGYDLTIGSGRFIDGFEDQLVGAELNKEIDINVVFPEDYNNVTLAGEPAVFKVTVNGIQYFELTEDFITNTMNFETEEAYRESLRQELEEINIEKMKSQKENRLYSAVIKGSEITIPDHLLEYYASDFRSLFSGIASSYGMDLETFVTLSGSSMEAFEADVDNYANSMATRELFIKALSSAEGIEVTDEEFDAKIAEYVTEYGYDSNEEFLQEADVEVIKEDILFQKLIQFLVAESVEV